MTEIRKRWPYEQFPMPEDDLERIGNEVSGELYEAAGCFRLFRTLHGTCEPAAALLGDFCFARFSEHLIRLDSVPLTDAFAAYLKQDCLDGAGMENYLVFLRNCREIVAHEH